MIIKPRRGLCNKLRVVFSFYKKSLELNESLIVWIKDNECEGYFLDYFETIDGVIFLQDNLNKEEIHNLSNKIDYEGYDLHNGYNPYLMNIYDQLKPLKYINDKIESIKSLMNNESYIAVHIIRTDHIYREKKIMNIQIILNLYIFYQIILKLFIQPTDNIETQHLFYSIFKDRIKYIDFIEKNTNLRQTSLEKAIIDLYMCVDSDEFKVSGWSSFSHIIGQLRKYNNINIY